MRLGPRMCGTLPRRPLLGPRLGRVLLLLPPVLATRAAPTLLLLLLPRLQADTRMMLWQRMCGPLPRRPMMAPHLGRAPLLLMMMPTLSADTETVQRPSM